MPYHFHLENRRKSICAGRSAQLALSVFLFFLAFGLAKDAAASIAFVQSASTAQTSGQTASKAFASSVTSGDLIIVGVFVNVGATVSVTDTWGDAYAQIGHQTVASDHDANVFVGTAGTSGADTITVNAGSGKNVYAFSIHEYSGVTTAVDASSTAQGSSTAPASGNLTTVTSNDLIFAWFTNGSNFANENFSSLNAAYTKREMSGSGTTQCYGFANCVESGNLVASTTLTTNATATLNVSDIWSATAIAFKGAGSTGTGAVASFSPSSLTFASQAIGVTSAAQTVTLNNTGSAALTLTSIALAGTNPGDFAQTNTCGSSVAAGANCTISVTFKPTASGTRAATVSFTDNATGSPQSVSLTGTGTAAVAGLSPNSLTFAGQAVGVTSAAQTITLTNTGNAVLTLTSIALTGTNPGDFVQTNTCGSSVAAGSNCMISVTFKPTASGTRAATVSFTDNATGSPQTVSLSGTGTMAVTSVSPASGATSVSTGTSVTALFNESMNASTINTSTFQLLNSSSGVVAATVSYNASTLTTTLTPSQALGNSATYTAVITGGSGGVQGSGGDTMAANYSWSFTTAASGTCPCSIWSSTATPGTVDGGDSKGVEIGVHFTSSQAGFITGIRFYKSAANTGTHIGNLWTTAGVLLGTATFSGESASGWQQVNFSSPIAVSANTTYVASYYAPAGHYSNDQEFFATAGVNNLPLQALANTVSPNGVYTYGANSVFPTSTWSASNYWVDVVFNNGTGTGSAPAASLSPTSLTFASQAVGVTSAAQTVTLNNTGNAALTLTSIALAGTNPGDFAQTNTCGSSVAAGANCTISVTFKPTASGTRAATVSFTDNATGSPQTVTLSGTGTSTGSALSISPPSLTFGNESVDTVSSPQSVTLDNTGSTVLSITSIAFAGADLTDFSENNTCGSSLAAGGTCTIAISFTPAASGARAASLTITDNASGSPQSVALSGTGTHDVILAWTASPTTGIAGYNVYRGTSPGGESSTPLNSTPINGITYADANVTAGATYYYVVMAVASNDVTQSAASNEASAKVPSP